MKSYRKKLVTSGGYTVAAYIPREFCKKLDLKHGDYVNMSIKGNKIIIEKSEEQDNGK